ncbi:hypothetical protein [Thalassotalea sediminis]|uniref:hypothetical protein n=1 Tax=Thalassotalea sediminis TaxID=1759089 RepID=UPI002573F122|nr:hypothetical protein [Thalassotalea sediminis]
MSDSTKLAKFTAYLAIFLAAFSSVDFIMDFVRFDLGLATFKSVGMLALSIFLYLSITKPKLFKKKPSI